MMKRSTRRILTTHTGSLPRPKDLLALLKPKEEGRLGDRTTLESRVRSAVADVVKREYTAIVDAGFLLQLDCPDLALGRHTQFAHLSLEEFRGKENVIAGCDCGFGTFAGRVQVDSNIVWHKLCALVEGARLASDELWR